MPFRANYVPEWHCDLSLRQTENRDSQKTTTFEELDYGTKPKHTSKIFLKSARLNAGIHCTGQNSCFFEVKVHEYHSKDNNYPISSEKLKSVLRLGWQTSSSVLVAGQDPESFAFDLSSLCFLHNSQFKKFSLYNRSPQAPSILTRNDDESSIEPLDIDIFSSGKPCYLYAGIRILSHSTMQFSFYISSIRVRGDHITKLPNQFSIEVPKSSEIQVLYPVITLRNAKVTVNVFGHSVQYIPHQVLDLQPLAPAIHDLPKTRKLKKNLSGFLNKKIGSYKKTYTQFVYWKSK